MKSIARMQPYLFPYIGYFQLIHSVDNFVIYDDIQYMKHGWINRNRILLNGKPHYITFPVRKDELTTLINERRFAENINYIKKKILSTLRQAYSKAPFFDPVNSLLENIINVKDNNVATFSEHCLVEIVSYLQIDTCIKRSSRLGVDKSLTRENRVIAIVKELGASHYINSIGGKKLYHKERFAEKGIKLSFLNSNDIVYPQLDNEFVPWLSIIDVMMFNPVEKLNEYLAMYELV